MKAKYVKPQLHVEYFSLTQSVAMACGWEGGSDSLGAPTHGNPSSCAWDWNGTKIFVSAPTCDMPWPEDTEFMGMCYNNPNGGQQIFAS